MTSGRVLGLQILILLLAFGLIGMWVQNAKGANVTNCQGNAVWCTVTGASPNNCDPSCSGFWPIEWCPDKKAVSGDGYCFDTQALTSYNCNENLLPDLKTKKRRCDCGSTGLCEWVQDPSSPDGFYWSGSLKCPSLKYTIC